MRALFEIGTDMKRFDALLDECEGDFGKAAEQMPDIESYLAALGVEQAEKLDGYVSYIRQLESEAVAAKAEEEQWAAKRKARERRAEFLKQRLKEHLERTGQQKVTTATGRIISIAVNGGKPAVEFVTGEPSKAVREEFVTVTRSWNKEAVRAALEAGQDVSYATLLPRGTSLRIR